MYVSRHGIVRVIIIRYLYTANCKFLINVMIQAYLWRTVRDQNFIQEEIKNRVVPAAMWFKIFLLPGEKFRRHTGNEKCVQNFGWKSQW